MSDEYDDEGLSHDSEIMADWSIPDFLRQGGGGEMKERPILFSGPMVRAILDGKKTQTRRPVKPQPVSHEEAEPNDLVFLTGELCKVKASKGWGERASGRLNAHPYSCPYGIPGDRLWLRETWKWAEISSCIDYKAGGYMDAFELYSERPEIERLFWEWRKRVGKAKDMPWRPSIHMPRWASRITLEVTGVRVERAQDITGGDGWAEGFRGDVDAGAMFGSGQRLERFWQSWDAIYSKNGLSWDQNPWVWVIEFRRL